MKRLVIGLALALGLIPVAASADATTTACSTPAELSNQTTLAGSACSLKKDQIGLEASYANATIDGGGNVTAYPQGTLRVGTTLTNLELDVTAPSAETVPGFKGTTELGFGAKYQLLNLGRGALSARASASLPSGSVDLGGNATTYAGGLVGSYAILPALNLSAASDVISYDTGAFTYGSTREAVGADLSVLRRTHLTGSYGLQTNALGPDSDSRPVYQVGVSQDLGRHALFTFALGRDPKVVTGEEHYVFAGLTALR